MAKNKDKFEILEMVFRRGKVLGRKICEFSIVKVDDGKYFSIHKQGSDNFLILNVNRKRVMMMDRDFNKGVLLPFEWS